MTATQEYLYIDVCHLPTNGAMMLPILAHIEAEPSPTLRTLMNMSSPLYIANIARIANAVQDVYYMSTRCLLDVY